MENVPGLQVWNTLRYIVVGTTAVDKGAVVSGSHGLLLDVVVKLCGEDGEYSTSIKSVKQLTSR